MRIVIASDHGGLDFKEKIKEYLTSKSIEIIDVGTYSKGSCNYPEFAKKAVKEILEKNADRGILICTTGEGIMMTANRYKGIRCGVAYDDEVTALMRKHNNANMIAFGAGFMKLEDCLRRIDIFLSTGFEGGRHLTRINMLDEI